MNDEIMRAIGLGKQVDQKNTGICPFCGHVVDLNDFRDRLSRKEFEISGLCQKCQDEVFAPPADEEDAK